tara:strand:+ start:194 stop:532 length:339 start_codon:yes stop_codon:yes gene_type:complete
VKYIAKSYQMNNLVIVLDWMALDSMNDETNKNRDASFLSFEDALRELESIVASLERGDVSLEAAISAFERGTALKTHCQARLEEARLQVEKIKIPDDNIPPSESAAFDATNC